MLKPVWKDLRIQLLSKGHPVPPMARSATQTFSPSATTPRAFEPSSAIAAESVALTLPLDIAHVAIHNIYICMYICICIYSHIFTLMWGKRLKYWSSQIFTKTRWLHRGDLCSIRTWHGVARISEIQRLSQENCGLKASKEESHTQITNLS
jgi:hypothetical protein